MVKKGKKLKLKPSARDKRRYFLVKSNNAKIESVILEYIGTLGFAKSSYIKVSTKDFPGKPIMRIKRSTTNAARAI